MLDKIQVCKCWVRGVQSLSDFRKKIPDLRRKVKLDTSQKLGEKKSAIRLSGIRPMNRSMNARLRSRY